MRIALIPLILSFLLLASASPSRSEQITLDPICTVDKYENAVEIGDLLAKLRDFDMTRQEKDIFAAYPLLAKLNNVVNSVGTIDTFRCQDDLQIVLKLVQLAKTDDRTIRVNASRLLANVTDNTTICGVLDAIAAGKLNDDTRFNLWQVVYVVAGYARKENQDWIKAVIAKEKSVLNRSIYPRILLVIDQTEGALGKNKRTESMRPQYEPSYQACLNLTDLTAALAPSNRQ